MPEAEDKVSELATPLAVAVVLVDKARGSVAAEAEEEDREGSAEANVEADTLVLPAAEEAELPVLSENSSTLVTQPLNLRLDKVRTGGSASS